MKILFWLISQGYLWLPRKIQKSVQKSLLLQQGIDQTQKIEFSNGEVQKITNFEIATNNIKLISINTIIVIFIEKVISIDNIIILGILIIVLSGQTYYYDQNEEIIVYYTLFCYLFNLLLSFGNIMIIAFQRIIQQNIINSQKCTIIAKFPDVSSKQLSNQNIELHSYETITWSQLTVGHIICLQQNEQSPADLLILDSSKEQVLINFDQRTPCSQRITINQTIKGNILDFKTKLSGTIQFTITDLSIQGTIKMKNDPKLTPFTKKNMIQRGEIQDSVDWIFGMVIRVGNDCIAQSNFSNQNFTQSSWIHNIYQQIILICIGLFIILFVPNIIFYSFQSYEKYFYSSITYCLLIIPQNLLWLNQLWLLINMIRNNMIFNKPQDKQCIRQNSMNRLPSEINENQLLIISENEKKVLLPIQKQFKINLLTIQQAEIDIQKKQQQKKQNFKGFQTFSPKNILDMIKGDMILIDNPKEIFKNKHQIMQIITKNKKQYIFNYQKLQELIIKASPTLKNNYEKLLIDTNKQQTNDEQKTQNLDFLLAEKIVPNLRNTNESLNQIKKLQLVSRQELVIKNLSETQSILNQIFQQLPKKKSTRYIFDSNFAKKSIERVDSMKDLNKINNNSSNSNITLPASLQKQRSQYFSKGGTMIKQFNVNSSLQISPKQNEDQVTDRLIGDYFNEQDFLDQLYKKDDTLHNEILLMILIIESIILDFSFTNNILSVFDDQTRELQFNFGNKFDESLLEFTKIFNYQLLCSTEIENSRLDYQLKTFIKKVISIENQVKVFEVLAFLEPTENRKNTLSVLVRDPESFLLEEGSILYTRIQTNELKSINKGKNDSNNKQSEYYNYYNEQLQELLWDGQSNFIYSKRQLNQDQTQEFLQKLSQLHDAYGNRSQEIEIEYKKLESQNEILFCIGIRSGNHHNQLQISQNEFNIDSLNDDKLFQTLQMQNIKTCLTTSESYEELIIFLRSHQVVQKEQIIHFHERDVQQLQYRFRQHIQYMLEEQDIMGCDIQKHLEKFIIISKQSFKIIMQDDYLKYHFVFIIEFSSGLGAYEFNGKCNGQLIKLLKLNKKKIITIGNSLQNNYLFNKSDISFTLTQNNPFFCITQPNFIVKNIKQMFQLLYFYCTQYLQNYISLLEIQLYRSTLIGLIVFGISLSQNDVNLYTLIIFYLIPSNLLTSIFQQYLLINQIDYDLKHFNSYAKRLNILKNENIFKEISKITIMALFDSSFVILLEKAIINLSYSDGKLNQTIQIVLLYIGIELLEKSKLVFIVFDMFNDILFKIKQILIIISITMVLSICYLIIQSIQDNQTISLQFNNVGLLGFIFMAIFLVGLSFVMYQLLKIINIEFSYPFDNTQLDIHMKEINNIKQNLNFEINEKGYFQNIKKMIETLFENMDIVDEQITKFIKADQTTIDYMDKNYGFYDRRTENDFMDFFRQQNWQKYSLSYVFIFYEVTIFIIHLYEIMMYNFLISILIIIIIQLLIQLLIVILQFKFINNRTLQQQLQILSFGLRFIFKILIDLLYFDQKKEFTTFLYHTLFIISFALTTQPKINIYLYTSLQVIMYLFNLVLDGFTINFEDVNQTIFCSLKYLFIIIEISYSIFNYIQKIQFLQRSSYVYQNRLTKEQKKINSVLGLLMPRFIQERMNKGQIQISQDQGDVSVLFCDIYQFDKVIKDQQEKIIEFLDTIYRVFDQLCQNYDLQKIETVGKTYMAAGGLKDYDVVIQLIKMFKQKLIFQLQVSSHLIILDQKNANSTSRALETAIQMMETVKTMKYGDNQDVQLKIGIHYGRVIAGVIGVHKPQFSLIGDTVNTTSRVCSTGEAGFITLSEAAYLNIKDNTKYQFEQRSVAAKGKGMIETYRLISKQKESTKSLTPKVSTKEYQDQISIQCLETKKMVNFKSSTDKKKILKKPSIQPVQIGVLNDHVKSPKLVIRQLHRETQSSVMPNMILKQKPSSENYQVAKRLNSIKSKSFNQNDDIQIKESNYLSNTKTPGFQKNFIQKRQSVLDNMQSNVQPIQNNQQDSITQIQFQTDSKPQNQVVQQQILQSAVNLSHQSNPQQFLNSVDQLIKVPDQQIDNNKQEGVNYIPRPQIKKKGTIILGELIQKKVGIMKSNTKILLPEEREKNQIVKISGVGGDCDSQMEQKKQIRNQKSLKLLQLQDSSSALKKSPENNIERLEELEIQYNILQLTVVKKKMIITPEQKFDYQTLEKIKKFKLDYDDKSTFEIDTIRDIFVKIIQEIQVSQTNLQLQTQYSNFESTVTINLKIMINNQYKEQEKSQMRIILIFLTAFNLFKGLLLFIIRQEFYDTQIELIIVQVCQFVINSILSICYSMIKDKMNLDFLKIIIWIYFFSSSSLSILIISFEKQKGFEVILQISTITSLYLNIYLSQILNYEDRQRFVAIFMIAITIMIVYEQYILEIIIFQLGISGLTFFCQMQEKQLLFKNYLISLQLSIQIAKYENMLQYLMPPHALRRLLNPDQEITDTFMDVLENTTVLFADIAGFTKYSSSVEPETVVDMLRNLFSSFDQYCQKAEIYKLFTIGDCYVCMGVLDCKNRDPAGEAQKVLAFGFSMIEIINHYKKDPQYQHLNMRIGVHTGRVLGGVVGTDVVRYDIYGEDVTIANLMESSGQEGKILVSEITKNLVENEYEGFQFDYAKDVYLPSKNLTISIIQSNFIFIPTLFNLVIQSTVKMIDFSSLINVFILLIYFMISTNKSLTEIIYSILLRVRYNKQTLVEVLQKSNSIYHQNIFIILNKVEKLLYTLYKQDVLQKL